MPCMKRELIKVTERDLIRCGHDLRMLRKCSLPPSCAKESSRDPHPLELSFKSAFAQRCRSDSRLRDPWKDVSNPEESRAPSNNELDRILNQVWVKAFDACDGRDSKPSSSRLRRKSTSDALGAAARASTEDANSKRPAHPPAAPTFETARRSSSRSSRHRADEKGAAEEETHHRPVMQILPPRVPSPASAAPTRFQSPIHLLTDTSDEEKENENIGFAGGGGYEQKYCKLLQDGKDMCALWHFLEPSTGEVLVCPRSVALRLERAYIARRSTVPLMGLGEDYDSMIAHFTYDRGSGSSMSLKTWDGAARDLSRIEVPLLSSKAVVHVAGPDPWRFVSEGPFSEPRRLTLTNEPVAPPSPLPSLSFDRRTYFINTCAYDQ